MTCPCCSGRPFDACCGPILDGSLAAPTPEALMRSRYTAYVRGAIDYLLESHHPSTRDQVDRDAATRWSKESTWLGLEVLATERGGADDEEGIVEFRARYRQDDAELLHHERSTFRRRDGRWHYVDGESVRPQPVRSAPKVGRNDPCPCGSGRKFKKCCG